MIGNTWERKGTNLFNIAWIQKESLTHQGGMASSSRLTTDIIPTNSSRMSQFAHQQWPHGWNWGTLGEDGLPDGDVLRSRAGAGAEAAAEDQKRHIDLLGRAQGTSFGVQFDTLSACPRHRLYSCTDGIVL